jgi:hypothetical protein
MAPPSVGPIHQAETEGIVIEDFDLSRCCAWFSNYLWITEEGKNLHKRAARCVSAMAAVSKLSGYEPMRVVAAKVARVLESPYSRSFELSDSIIEASYIGLYCGIEFETQIRLEELMQDTGGAQFLTIADSGSVIALAEDLLQSWLWIVPGIAPSQTTLDYLETVFDFDASAFFAVNAGGALPVRQLNNWRNQTKVRFRLKD